MNLISISLTTDLEESDWPDYHLIFHKVCKIILNSLCAYDMGNQEGISAKKV